MKLLYLMHVPWGWIKQRPHFFAEKLSERMDVDVVCAESIKTVFNRTKRYESDINPQALYTPLATCDFALNKICSSLYARLVGLQLGKFSEYTHIWIGSTLMYRLIKPLLKPNHILIYDCMDDDMEFPIYLRRTKLLNTIKSYEHDLALRANYIFFSSVFLRNKVVSRTNCESSKCYVVNNALERPAGHATLPDAIQRHLDMISQLPHVLMYVGMIAEWFDFEAIQRVLDRNPNMHIVLVGPSEVNLPLHKQIHYVGKVEREYIFSLMDKADGLIMPFVVNDLIKSVNPVKLYEYIYADKPIIVPSYNEVKQFLPYINTYDNFEELNALCVKLQERQLLKPSHNDGYDSFVNSNTWDGRTEFVLERIIE